MSYNSESAFGKEWDKGMEKQGWIVHNIQTPTTERGCPDRFMQRAHSSIWVELKNVREPVNTPVIEIPYRDGQQSWLYEHYRHGGLGFTAVAGSNGILVFRNTSVYRNKVYRWGESPQIYVTRLYSETISEWLATFKVGGEDGKVRW
jgi:hypothetical protein